MFSSTPQLFWLTSWIFPYFRRLSFTYSFYHEYSYIIIIINYTTYTRHSTYLSRCRIPNARRLYHRDWRPSVGGNMCQSAEHKQVRRWTARRVHDDELVFQSSASVTETETDIFRAILHASAAAGALTINIPVVPWRDTQRGAWQDVQMYSVHHSRHSWWTHTRISSLPEAVYRLRILLRPQH